MGVEVGREGNKGLQSFLYDELEGKEQRGQLALALLWWSERVA